MTTEDYVSFETAKLLKEKGFNETSKTIGTYNHKGEFYLYCHENGYNHNHLSTWYSAPTLQMAIKWLKEVHNILVVVDYEYECTDTSYFYKIYRLGEHGKPERVAVKGVSYDKNNNPTTHIVGWRDYERSNKDYSTREEAKEEGIKYALESLIF